MSLSLIGWRGGGGGGIHRACCVAGARGYLSILGEEIQACHIQAEASVVREPSKRYSTSFEEGGHGHEDGRGEREDKGMRRGRGGRGCWARAWGEGAREHNRGRGFWRGRLGRR